MEGTGEHRGRDDERPNGTPGRTREDAEVDPCPANPPPLSAHRFITGLNRRRARRVTQEIGDLRNYPFFAMPHDLAKLKGRKGYYRIRIGDLRVIFRVFEEEKEIYIEKIDHRGKIYK